MDREQDVNILSEEEKKAFTFYKRKQEKLLMNLGFERIEMELGVCPNSKWFILGFSMHDKEGHRTGGYKIINRKKFIRNNKKGEVYRVPKRVKPRKRYIIGGPIGPNAFTILKTFQVRI